MRRCNRARVVARNSRDLALLLLEKMCVSMQQTHGIQVPKPPAPCRFETKSPRLAQRVRKAGILEQSAAAESASDDWAIIKEVTGRSDDLMGGWFAHAMMQNKKKSSGGLSVGLTIKERISKFNANLANSMRQEGRKSLPGSKGNILSALFQNQGEEEEERDKTPDDPLKGFVAVNRSHLKIARKFVGERSGFRIPPLPLWMLQQDAAEVVSTTAGGGSGAFANSAPQPPKAPPRREGLSVSPRKKQAKFAQYSGFVRQSL